MNDDLKVGDVVILWGKDLHALWKNKQAVIVHIYQPTGNMIKVSCEGTTFLVFKEEILKKVPR